MNNRIQQRMDKSVKDANQNITRYNQAQTEKTLIANQEKARKLIPVIDSMIKTETNKTRRNELISLRGDYRRILGLTVDRKLKELA